MLLIVLAVVFLVSLFFVKNKSYFTNKFEGNNGITYGNMSLAEFINQDTDGDGVLDWEENLYGTNPTQKDSDGDGVEDGVEIAQIKSKLSLGEETVPLGGAGVTLTQTENLSRELFSTAIALSQINEVNADAANTLTSSIAEQIQNVTPRRVFLFSELSITTDNSAGAMQKYISDITNIYKIYPPGEKTALDVLVEFASGEEENFEVLSDLTLIVAQTKNVLGAMLVMKVPSELAEAHLEMLNALERVMENTSDIQLFELDPVVAMGAISKYEENVALLESATVKIGDIVKKKLNN